MSYLTPIVTFIVGVVIGILMTFSCIRLSLVLPSLALRFDDTKNSKKNIKPRWNPGMMVPPPGRSVDPLGPGPIDYDSPADFLDPIDPKK